jgi:hypothetical protein
MTFATKMTCNYVAQIACDINCKCLCHDDVITWIMGEVCVQVDYFFISWADNTCNYHATN